ncbi:MAG: hypothetical protein M1827_006116 [Pycnora praestabilis]|nr:MAG: hypothetical protein M1827_006116 [Pycnora praestabilis]
MCFGRKPSLQPTSIPDDRPLETGRDDDDDEPIRSVGEKPKKKKRWTSGSHGGLKTVGDVTQSGW